MYIEEKQMSVHRLKEEISVMKWKSKVKVNFEE